ncbi:hypothetical protein [Caulobacter sp. DWP3-1-3b2]|uniref:hypothetical protein n=1 Tax=Caulobacter sp. DWP3-1-3b2 TaxID=2804643 RepID=UPI003CEC7EA7
MPTAHNGWLDILAQLGWIGVGLCALVLGSALLVGVFRFQRLRDGYWTPLFLVIFLMTTLSESFILERNGIAWGLACAAVTRLLGPVLADLGAARWALPSIALQPPPLAWSLASGEPTVEIWATDEGRASTFGKRPVSPFGA